MTSTAVHHPTRSSTGSWATFVRHLVEMIAVMVVGMYAGMFLVGPALSKLFGLFGHPHALDGDAESILLMVGYMVGGLVAWLAFRRYRRTTVIEIGTSLLIPYVALVGPFLVGRISAESFTTSMHALMLVLLIVAMLHRRNEFEFRPRRVGSHL
jgi:drug/metabolite transporter (DMT)-like permease